MDVDLSVVADIGQYLLSITLSSVQCENSVDVCVSSNSCRDRYSPCSQLILGFPLVGYFRGMTFSWFSRIDIEPRKFSASKILESLFTSGIVNDLYCRGVVI